MKSQKSAMGFLMLGSLLFSSTSLLSAPKANALPTTSCKTLFLDLSNYLKSSTTNTVHVLHMTNYQANGFWVGGYTQTNLTRNPFGHLVGSGGRLLSNRYATSTQPFSINHPDPISYDIDPLQSTIVFSSQYGPYKISCIGNKFALVNTGDSFETFTFAKGPIILKPNKKGSNLILKKH